MKKHILIILLIFFNSISIAQENTRKPDSYTILRLMIFNQQGEVLLMKSRNGWMTPSTRHNNKLSINESLEKLAFDFGIDISEPKLSGLFTFSFTYKSMSSFRSHYSANYTQGELIFPDYALDAQWFPIDKAIAMMSLPDTKASFAIRDMTKQILLNPETSWGGAFALSKDESNKTTHKLLDDFYPLITDKNKKSAPNDSYSIQRLIITNDRNEILIYKGRDYWLTPALRHNKVQSITEALNALANNYGLKISRPKLAGLFTYKFGFKDGLSFRSYYTANLIGSDQFKAPAPITHAKWVPRFEVMGIIEGVESRKMMLKQIIEHPNKLWGGSFYLYDENGKRKSKVLEEIYSLF